MIYELFPDRGRVLLATNQTGGYIFSKTDAEFVNVCFEQIGV